MKLLFDASTSFPRNERAIIRTVPHHSWISFPPLLFFLFFPLSLFSDTRHDKLFMWKPLASECKLWELPKAIFITILGTPYGSWFFMNSNSSRLLEHCRPPIFFPGNILHSNERKKWSIQNRPVLKWAPPKGAHHSARQRSTVTPKGQAAILNRDSTSNCLFGVRSSDRTAIAT